MRKRLFIIAFWMVFYVMWSRMMYFYVDNIPNRLYFSALDVSLVMLAFYTLYLYIMPRYLRSKNLTLLIGSAILLIAVLSLIYSGIMLLFLRIQLIPISFDFSWNYTDLQYNRFFIALTGAIGGCALKLAIDRMALSKRIEEVQKERSIAELTYLRSQLNPHFLFNALNTVYAQVELRSDQAKNTLSVLADLLRYQLYECNSDHIPLEQEVTYLENYFNLQQLRKDNCTCLFKAEIQPGYTIAPLLLVPFIENAFKYVSDHSNLENSIFVSLKTEKQWLRFNCSNTIDGQHIQTPANSGIGLENVRKRLGLIYGEDYQLHITSEGHVFNVDLKLLLHAV